MRRRCAPCSARRAPAPTRGSTSSTSDRRVVLGRIVGAHGVRGAMNVRYFGDGPANLLRMPAVAVAAEASEVEAPVFEVGAARPGRPGQVRLTLVGVEDRDAAEALRGRLVLGEATYLAPLPAGEFYWHQLIGCQVEGHDGTRIGTVREVWETGASDVLVVEAEDGRRVLLPTAKPLLREIDLDASRIVIEVIPGLLDST
ncbi:MAG: 16S rRNA processing protein RimM [Deltaproteobacteria bacterium]|nr:MAG: 16S rRNA processing protein RimM [Deltaproteobacteria bacterium]